MSSRVLRAYFGIAIWARAGSTAEFYAANRGVHPVMNGMATAADWMSAASFISMAGLIAFTGYDNSTYLMGWTGGYVLLAMLLAPYLRKFGKFTVPEFIGDRFYSKTARIIGVICAADHLDHLCDRPDGRRRHHLCPLSSEVSKETGICGSAPPSSSPMPCSAA
jgi:Na+(H+)/acetate symporter ActP